MQKFPNTLVHLAKRENEAWSSETVKKKRKKEKKCERKERKQRNSMPPLASKRDITHRSTLIVKLSATHAHN